MSEQQMTRAKLREQVAEEVRALMARRRITGARVGLAIGKSDMYVSRRLRGETSFDVDDLEEIAALLGVSVSSLFPASASEVQPANVSGGQIRTSAYPPDRPQSRPRAEIKRPPNFPGKRVPNLIRRPMSTKPYAA